MVISEKIYNLRKEYHGMDVSQARRLKNLERENAMIRKLVADQARYDEPIPQKALKGTAEREQRRQAISQIIPMVPGYRAMESLGEGATTRVLVSGFGVSFFNAELFCTLKQTRILIERWQRHYNTVRPYSPLGYAQPTPKKRHLGTNWLVNDPATEAISMRSSYRAGLGIRGRSTVRRRIRKFTGGQF